MIDAILVPYRPDGGQRDRNWQFVRSTIEPLAPMFVADSDGDWNRAAAVNRAARAADLAGGWEVAAIIDADVLVAAEQVEAAARRVRSTGRFAVAFTVCHELDRTATEQVIAGAEPAPTGKLPSISVSRCIVIRRDLWDNLEGLDEKFTGYGGEDSALWIAAQRTVGVFRQPGAAWHLWHRPDPAGQVGSDHAQRTLARIKMYREQPVGRMLELARGV